MQLRRSQLRFVLLAGAPGMLLAVIIITYPLWQVLRFSVSDITRFGKVRGFAGLSNFQNVLTSVDFYDSVARSLVWTVVVVAGTVLISIPTAVILSRDFYGRGVARVIIMLPWAISLTMMAIIWRWTLNGELGMLNHTLVSLGVLDKNVVWLAEVGSAFSLQIIIGILVSIPFATTILLGGLSSVPDDLYDAAAIEGASNWRQHMTLTIPLLRPFIKIAIVLNIIYVFNSFPIIWVTTQGGPGGGTDILVTYLYKLAFRFGKMGEAAVVSLAMFIILVGLAWIYIKLSAKNEPA